MSSPDQPPDRPVRDTDAFPGMQAWRSPENMASSQADSRGPVEQQRGGRLSRVLGAGKKAGKAASKAAMRRSDAGKAASGLATAPRYLASKDGQLDSGEAMVDGAANAAKGLGQAVTDRDLSDAQAASKAVDQLPKAGVAADAGAANYFTGGAARPLVNAAAPLVERAATAATAPARPVADRVAQPFVAQARKAWRGMRLAVKLGISAMLALVLVVITTTVAVINANNQRAGQQAYAWNVDPTSDAAQTIPAPYLDAYVASGLKYGIPWTLLAAVGGRATYQGRINPYRQAVPDITADMLAAAPATSSGALLVGDSLAVGAASPLAGMIGGLSSITQVGASTAWGVSRVRDAQPPSGKPLIVILGTNDAKGSRGSFASQVDRLMATLGAGHPVYWLTLGCRNAQACPNARTLNRELVEAQSRWPGQLVVLDWAAHAAATNVPMEDDLVHYKPDGYAAMARFIAANTSGGPLLTETGQASRLRIRGPGLLPEPEGECPSLDPPVRGKSRKQGAGPLMLSPAAMQRRGLNGDAAVQDICVSADILAARIRTVAPGVAASMGLYYPQSIGTLVAMARQGNQEAADTVNRFWADVMDSVGILGSPKSAACRMPAQGSKTSQEWVGVGIQSLWDCALQDSELKSVDRIVNGESGTRYVLLSQEDAAARAVDEALDVAWTWSRWGTQGCVSMGDAAGIFPLTQAQFDKWVPPALKREGRCDEEASILAAARMFTAGESSEPATRGDGTYGPAAGGWGAFPYVTGPTGVADDYASNGKWTAIEVDGACKSTIAFSLDAAAADPGNPAAGAPLRDVQRITQGKATGKLRSRLVDYLGSTVARFAQSPECAAWSGAEPAQWYAQLSGGASGDVGVDLVTTLPVSTTGSGKAQPGDIRAALLRVAGEEFNRIRSQAPRRGSTAMLPRLSPNLLSGSGRPDVTAVLMGGNITKGMDLVNVAGFYGGLYVGDQAGRVGMSSGGQIGIVGDQIPFASLFNEAGVKHGVDPRMLAAVAFVESNFNESSRCPFDGGSGGYGMMQFETPTARSFGINPCDPAQAIDAAARYLSGNYADVRKKHPLVPERDLWRAALANYNSGNGGWRWLGKGGEPGMVAYLDKKYYPGKGEITRRYISVIPGERSVPNKWDEYIGKFPTGSLIGVQTLVGPDGCPSEQMSRSVSAFMDDGAARIGLAELCRMAVMQAPTPQAAQAVKYALTQVGKPYRGPDQGGAKPPNSWDCSKLTSAAWRPNGVQLFPLSYTQWDQTRPVMRSTWQSGDLAFYFKGDAHHVGMLIGGRYMVHAANSSRGVIVSDFLGPWYGDHFSGVRRVTLTR